MLEIPRRLWYTVRMKYDYVTLYNQNAAYYNAHPTAKRALKIGNVVLTWLFFACYGILWMYVVDLEPLEAMDWIKILFVPLLTLLTVSVMRIAIQRPRPYAEDGAGITPLVEKKADDKSFPSRHLACAAVIAMTFLPYYPIAGAFLLGGSVLLGYIRFALGLHYPSDLLAGTGLGIFLGSFIFIL